MKSGGFYCSFSGRFSPFLAAVRRFGCYENIAPYLFPFSMNCGVWGRVKATWQKSKHPHVGVLTRRLAAIQRHNATLLIVASVIRCCHRRWNCGNPPAHLPRGQSTWFWHPLPRNHGHGISCPCPKCHAYTHESARSSTCC